MVLKEVEETVGKVTLTHTELLRPLEVLDASKAGRIAVIVGDHDGRVEGLEVQDDERTLVERRLRLHDERHALGGVLLADLLAVRREEHEAFGFRDLEHDRLDLELTTASANRVEVDAEDSSRFAVGEGERSNRRKSRKKGEEAHQVWSMTSAASNISISISTRFLQYWKTREKRAGSPDLNHCVSVLKEK